jgi:uncharacterized repeat protein (TIGR03806 family)
MRHTKPCTAPAILFACLVLTSCHRSERPARVGAGPRPLQQPPADPPARGARPLAPALHFPLGGGQGTVQVQRAFPNLSLPEALDLAAPRDGSNRVFVACKDGRIHVFANRDDVAQARVYLDISDRVYNWFEVGLLGFTFDPDYASNGYLYVHYVDRAFVSHISRFTVSGHDPDLADANSEHVLLRVQQPEANHNGGSLQFGPDRMLYIGFGDGGGLDDQYNNAQNLDTLLGAMLRIDPHGRTGALPYGIPGDNPYVGQPGRDEIWAHGLRSPWRFSIDPVSGLILLGDVGQDFHDEIDVVRRGGNYGWPIYEGPRSHRNPRNLPPTAFDQPFTSDPRAELRSVIGGYVYRGTRLASLVGEYVYGDHVYGTVWGLRAQGGQVVRRVLGSVPGVASFGVDERGEVYAVSFNGTLHRFAAQGGQGAFPSAISQTGLLADVRTGTWVPGLMPFSVNAPLWSDHAHKTRFFVVPDRETIAFAATQPWGFPLGSVLVKHFAMEMVAGVPSSRRRLETRVMVQQRGGWVGATYRWAQDGSEAWLVTSQERETLVVSDRRVPGGLRQQDWVYPGINDCVQCHTPAAGHVLGLRTAQLQGPSPVTLRHQLEELNAMGYFDRDIGAVQQYPRLVDPWGRDGSLAERARSYLDANCAPCHRPGGALQGAIDLRAGVADHATGLLWVRPTRGDLNLPDPFRIRPGDPGNSVLWHRMVRLDGVRMPPLSSMVVDQDGLKLIERWISGL